MLSGVGGSGICAGMDSGVSSWLAGRVPAPFDRALTQERVALLLQFVQFGTVGLAGFAVDTAVVYGLRAWLGLIGAGLVSYVIAATVTWLLNRRWTFRGRGGAAALHRQWAAFLLANLLGFVLNRGTYIALIATSALCVAYPVLAVFAGAVAGMFVNFSLSRAFVFR